jgi:predicted RecA/RadA family phage recombinase
MKNLIQKGKVIDYTIPAETTIVSGSLVEIGAVVGVAISGGVAGEQIAVSLSGVYEVEKVSGVVSQGQKLYSNGSGKATTTVSTNKFLGWAFAAEISGAATVKVKLIG